MFIIVGLLNIFIGVLLMVVSGGFYFFIEPKLLEMATDLGMSYSNKPYIILGFLLAIINFIFAAMLLRNKNNLALLRIGVIFVVISFVALGWLSMILTNNSVYSIYNLTNSF